VKQSLLRGSQDGHRAKAVWGSRSAGQIN